MEAMAESPRKKPVVTIYGVVVLLIVLALLAASVLSPLGGIQLTAAKKMSMYNKFNQVQAAVLSYYTEYSVYPVAANSATLVRMLDGTSGVGNSRQITFVSFKASDLNAKGELLDPWGRPLQISVDSDGNIKARSAGPDKTFGTADDIVGQFTEPPK